MLRCYNIIHEYATSTGLSPSNHLCSPRALRPFSNGSKQDFSGCRSHRNHVFTQRGSHQGEKHRSRHALTAIMSCGRCSSAQTRATVTCRGYRTSAPSFHTVGNQPNGPTEVSEKESVSKDSPVQHVLHTPDIACTNHAESLFEPEDISETLDEQSLQHSAKPEHTRRGSDQQSKEVHTLRPLTWSERREQQALLPANHLGDRGSVAECTNETVETVMVQNATWSSSIDILFARYDYKSLSEGQQSRLRFLRFEKSVILWINEIANDWTIEGLRTAWTQLPKTARSARWSHIMLWLLEVHPARALDFLLATNVEPYPPAYQVADAIDLLATRCRRHREFATTHNLAEAFRTLLHERMDVLPVAQETMTFILRRSNLEEVLLLYTLFKARAYVIQTENMLRFAYAVAKSGDWMRALELLREEAKAGADKNATLFQGVCSMLLRQAATTKDQKNITVYVVKNLVSAGVRLNVVTYNIILMNAFKDKDFETAWQVYDQVLQNFAPDNFTFTIALKGTTMSNDHFRWRRIYSEIRDDYTQGLLTPNSYLVTELVYSSAYFSKRSDFGRAVHEYEKHCNLQPLKDLGMVREDYDPHWVESGRALPSTATLSVMMLIYIRSTTNLERLAKVYLNYQRLLHAADPILVPTAAQTYVYNAFLKAFTRNKLALHMWPKVLRDMAMPVSPYVINRDTGKPFVPAQANVQTWSILVNSLIRQKEVVAAEKTLQLMIENGMRPNKVTWTSLIGGYARLQFVEKVAATLLRMEAEELKLNEHIMKALQPLDDRAGLLRMVRQMRDTASVAGKASAPQSLENAFGDDEAIKAQSGQSQAWDGIEDLFEDEDIPNRNVGNNHPCKAPVRAEEADDTRQRAECSQELFEDKDPLEEDLKR